MLWYGPFTKDIFAFRPISSRLSYTPRARIAIFARMLSLFQRIGTLRTIATQIAFFASLVGSQLVAQASAYIPLDDNAYRFADALIARGRLGSLRATERPYKVADFKAAIAADTATASRNVQALITALEMAIARYDLADIAPGKEGLRYTVNPYLLATAQTSGKRELMLADSNSKVRPGFGGVGMAQFGPLIAVARAYNDPRLRDDPEFTGVTKNSYVGRMEEAYISAQFKYGEVTAGRLGRNWGPSQLDGLLVGNYVYSYDQFYTKFGVKALSLSSIFTRLDDQTRNVGGIIDSANRFFSVHQLALKLGNFEAAVSEAVIYGGANETYQPAYVTPVVPYILTQTLEKVSGNILFGVDLSYRSKYGNFSGQGMLDDVAKDRCGPSCTKPNSFGFTFGAEGVPVYGDQKLFASYTLVSNLAYRNSHWESHYTSRGISLGRGSSDYEEVRIGADLLVIPSAPLRLYIARRRQGEGDYNQRHPTVAEYPVTEQFLQGVEQKTWRFAVSGGADIAKYFRVNGDLGINSVTNSQHVVGVKKSEFAGRFQVTIDSPWRLRGLFSAE